MLCLVALLMYCRFDLIFLMLDPQDELYDRKLAKHLVSLYYQGADDIEQDIIVIFLQL